MVEFDDDFTSVSRRLDDFDDDATDVVRSVTRPQHADDFDDDFTTVSQAPDEFDDDLTAVARPPKGDSGASLSGRARTKQEVPMGTNPKPGVARASGPVSLRDRVPETAERWTPPARPRSPEYQAPTVSRPRPWRTLAVLLGLSALLVLASWYFFVRSSGEPIDQSPATTDDVGVVDDS